MDLEQSQDGGGGRPARALPTHRLLDSKRPWKTSLETRRQEEGARRDDTAYQLTTLPGTRVREGHRGALGARADAHTCPAPQPHLTTTTPCVQHQAPVQGRREPHGAAHVQAQDYRGPTPVPEQPPSWGWGGPQGRRSFKSLFL